MGWKERLPLLAAALWWGSLTAIGFIAVPTLFAHAASPQVAGALAARLFTAQAWCSLGCGMAILVSARGPDGMPSLDWARGALGYVLGGMLLALLVEFAVAPRITARQDLALWHSAGTAMYAVQWICALVVLWKVGGERPGSLPAQG